MRFTPIHLHVVRLHWEGTSNNDIALKLNRSAAWVSSVLCSDEAKEIYKRLENRVLDTSVQIQTILQAAAPLALDKKIQLLNSANDSVANKAAQELLELAGHVATRQVEVRRPDHIEEEFKNKSEEEIRQRILNEINGEMFTEKIEETLH